MLIQTDTQTSFLSDVRQAMLHGEVNTGMDELVARLYAVRAGSSLDQWREFVERCVQHPIRDVLHQDPLTRRCYEKPRGYAGDAPMLDLVYGLIDAPATTTSMGAEVFRYGYASPLCESVRTRREMVGRMIDRVADGREEYTVLSVACGHIREAQLSQAVRSGQVRDFVGVDQDLQSLAVVNRELGPLGVRGVEGTVKAILQERLSLDTFDLVYAVGLYDYLPQPVATVLTARLFRHVAPGGTLLIPNLVPGIGAVGYMEAFMDWNMIYRDEEQLKDVASAIDPIAMEKARLYREEGGNVVFLEITKPGS